jgi:hypothetical protein
MTAKFNIQNSKIDQLNDSGNNIKLNSETGDNSVSESGNIVHTEGTENRVSVCQPKKGLWSSLVMWFRKKLMSSQGG